MTLENSIRDTISKKLEDGTIEKLIEQQLEKGIVNALENLFRSYGDVTKIIEEQVKSVMVPYLETYDYSKYITKLDSVMVDVLKNSALENKKLLENFKSLMNTEDNPKTIKVTDLYEKWMDYVAKSISTSGLEVVYEDGVSYESVEVSFEIDYNESRNWSSFEYAVLKFECEKDEDMNFEIGLSRYTKGSDKGWDMRYDGKHELRSLRYLNDFEIYLMKLSQNHTTIIIDEDGSSDEVQPEAEPEPTFS
ncbi:hypothetical protein [Paenibacillus sp. ISL-20]|uniref:hypothetical protein n=1 Tax=Paenibacillus sp. ISL-20 TaxID=2819163 RepID=UPI001BE71D37|nr:hypothetical protein [Paenibacillus sp. ISL-20]MBT2759998.1 hypothetical protein [Paenibacillus sp. ISL-20]